MLLKRLLALLLCGTLLSGLAASAQAVEFPDVSQEHWAHSDIQRASDCGLIQGLEDGTFRPEEKLNRASFVTILQRMFSWEAVTPASPTFSDVQPGDWYYTAVETAFAQGVLEAGEAFHPLAYISREDMAVMLVRALGYETLANDIAGEESPFPDVDSHAGHIALARAIGMTNGVEVDGQLLFQPEAFATRGQAAAMLVRVYERYTSKIEFLNGFYAFSSYGQIGLTREMDAVSLGWSRLEFDLASGARVNTQRTNGNDWAIPAGAESATSYFQENGTPYHLNVYADTTQNVTLADGSTTSVLEAVLPDSQARAQAVEAIAAASLDYAGITIDFEGLRTGLLRADFVAFLTELRAALPAGKTLYVCVPPDDWYQGYDYRAIGEVCDKVILMAHDYQWTSVPEGYVGVQAPDSPVTPFPSIYRALCSITDAETGVQDRSKIALQISFGSAGFAVDGSGLLADTTIYHPAPEVILQRLRQSGTVVSYDESDRNPAARYTTEEGLQVVLWYEDARSTADKLDLARMFGITGVSLWRLGTIPTAADVPNYDVWSAILAQR